MNYVGHLAETVFVTVKELYCGLNPATLTGGIDVIVVRQPDGSFQCSPFHVRFGKMGVLRSKEKVVDIEINGEPVDLHMKLGDNGEAFFVEENENMEAEVPAHLCTSPIPIEISEVSEVAESPASMTSSSSTRRRKRRRKCRRSDEKKPLREDASSSSEERETPEKDFVKHDKSLYFSVSEEPTEDVTGAQIRAQHPYSEGECSLNESVFYSRPTSPNSDSELLVKPQETIGLQMQWNWGDFPEVCQSERVVTEQRYSPDHSHFRTIKRQVSFDMGLSDSSTTVTTVRPEPRTSKAQPCSSDNFPQISCSNQLQISMQGSQSGLSICSAILDDADREVRIINAVTTEDVISDRAKRLTNTANPVGLSIKFESLSMFQSETSPSAVHKTGTHSDMTQQGTSIERDSGIEASTEGFAEQDGKVGTVTRSPYQEAESAKSMQPNKSGVQIEEQQALPLHMTKAEESHKKKKGKRNQHLGPADIYLDDLSTLDPDVVALYFPKSESESVLHYGAELSTVPSRPRPQSGQLSPQSLSTGNVDSGTDYLSDSTTDTLDVTMSLCGTEGPTSKINKEKFMEHIVTYQAFVNNPAIIDDPNLVICINSNYYNWAVAAPMIMSMQAFQKNLPKSTVEQLVKDKMPKKSGRWWFSWRKRDMTLEPGSKPESVVNKAEASPSLSIAPSVTVQPNQQSSDDDGSVFLKQKEVTETMNTLQCLTNIFRKSLRLTSQKIESLNLREGANSIVFSVTTQYQGTCRCEATIYLWNWNDKVIISDIDGTITRSDALGHILPQLGKDWTHQGIAKLYHKIQQNGYKFLYCSARAIGMANITKNYLQWVNDEGIVLPKGPVMLAPSSLFTALHREVIEKRPEVFKITCLSDIQDLFQPYQQPFYAAFGNRTNDVFAYKNVGVPDSRIFTVNPRGELIQESTKSQKSSYSHLSELVDHFFPLLGKGQPTSFDYPEYSHFSYWRETIPPADFSSL